LAKVVDPETHFRVALAKHVVLWGITGLFVVSGVTIALAGDNRTEMVRLVFASMIPLLGTWVGTVLAFYFARDSLQAATESTARLVGRLDPQTPVTQVMVPRAKIIKRVVESEEKAKSVPLAELTSLMRSRKKHRIPLLLDATGAVVYVVHDSTINAHAALHPAAEGEAAPTVGNLLGESESQKMITAIAFVAEAATVAEARAAMAAVDGCNDVFVTTDGRRKDAVLGWLTNTDLAALR
jgi:hypothetical protein